MKRSNVEQNDQLEMDCPGTSCSSRLRFPSSALRIRCPTCKHEFCPSPNISISGNVENTQNNIIDNNNENDTEEIVEPVAKKGRKNESSAPPLAISPGIFSSFMQNKQDDNNPISQPVSSSPSWDFSLMKSKGVVLSYQIKEDTWGSGTDLEGPSYFDVSPDGSYYAFQDDGTLILFDPEKGAVVKRAKVQGSSHSQPRFVDQGRRILVGHNGGFQVFSVPGLDLVGRDSGSAWDLGAVGGMAIGQSEVFVTDFDKGTVFGFEMQTNGTVMESIGEAANGMSEIHAVALDLTLNHMYVTSLSGGVTVLKSRFGSYYREDSFWSTGLITYGIAVDDESNVVVASDKILQVFSSEGKKIHELTDPQFKWPFGVGIDRVRKRLLVSDFSTGKLLVF